MRTQCITKSTQRENAHPRAERGRQVEQQVRGNPGAKRGEERAARLAGGSRLVLRGAMHCVEPRYAKSKRNDKSRYVTISCVDSQVE